MKNRTPLLWLKPLLLGAIGIGDTERNNHSVLTFSESLGDRVKNIAMLGLLKLALWKTGWSSWGLPFINNFKGSHSEDQRCKIWSLKCGEGCRVTQRKGTVVWSLLKLSLNSNPFTPNPCVLGWVSLFLCVPSFHFWNLVDVCFTEWILHEKM